MSRRSSLPIGVAVLLLCACALADAAEPSRLLAQGSGRLGDNSQELLWVAACRKDDNADNTIVYFRHVYRNDPWKALPVIGGDRPTTLGACGADLLIVLGDGTRWARFSEDGNFSYGDSLPKGGRISAIAGKRATGPGRGEVIWAVASIAGGMQALATTRPTTSPAPARLVLFRLDAAGTWAPLAEVPADPAAMLAMAVVGQAPQLVVGETSGNLIVLAFAAEDRSWARKATVRPGFAISSLKMLADEGEPPAIWAAPEAGPGKLWIESKSDYRAVEFALADAKPAADERDLALAAQSFHLFYRQDGKLLEQPFDQAGKTQRDAMELLEERRSSMPINWTTIAMLVILGMLLMGGLRYQRSLQLIRVGPDWVIAAPLARLAAAAIDASPVIAAWAYIGLRASQMANPTLNSFEWDKWCIGAGVVYIVHTWLTELALGRTIGKMALGLHMVQIDGSRPGPGPILARNLLRVLDVPVPPVWVFGLLVDVAVLIYSPLRQRIGDLAGKTLVVRRLRPGEEKEAAAIETQLASDEDEDESV